MQTVSTEELHQRFKSDHGHHTILDARSRDEYASGHVPGAINIPHTELESRLGEVPKDYPVYVHCQMGGRAQQAARILEANGFQVFCVATGGMRDWTEKGFPVRKPGA